MHNVSWHTAWLWQADAKFACSCISLQCTCTTSHDMLDTMIKTKWEMKLDSCEDDVHGE